MYSIFAHAAARKSIGREISSLFAQNAVAAPNANVIKSKYAETHTI